MKVSNKSVHQNIISSEQQPKNVQNTTNPSFGAGALGAGIINTMDAIDRGGLVASFLVQDFFGLNIPRTATGFFRNSEVTGEYNYQEAAEVGIREFLSGPAMFAIPMLMLWGIKKQFGKSNDVPVEMIRFLGAEYAKFAQTKGIADLKDLENVKKSFYTNIFDNILKNAHGGEKAVDCRKEAEYFANELVAIEKLRKNKQTRKTFWQKFRGKKVAGSAEDRMSALIERFTELRKQHTGNPTANFMNAKIKGKDQQVKRNFEKITNDIRNFVEDAVDTLTKKSQKTQIGQNQIKEFFTNFAHSRMGSRVLTNFSMIAGIIAFCSIIPKLYQLSDKNPGLNGLEDNDEKPKNDKPQNSAEVNKTEPKQVKSENENIQNDSPAKEQTKQVAFCGAAGSLGKWAAKENGIFSRFAKAFEFDSYNVSLMGLISTCSIGVVIPRLLQAREENEYKEVLFRDTTTVATIIFAAKALQHIFAGICTKLSGFGLANLPKSNTPLMKKIFNYIRPHKGVNVLSSSELLSKYSSLDKYNNGIAGFAEFVDASGGNVRKMFSTNKEAEKLLKKLYDASSNGIVYNNASNKDIIASLQNAVKDKKCSETLNKLYGIFTKDAKSNTFLRKAKVLNSSFNFATLFLVVPILLGWLIPRLNESFTKKRMQAKKDAKMQSSKIEDVNEPKKQSQLLQAERSKVSESNAFNKFLKSN